MIKSLWRPLFLLLLCIATTGCTSMLVINAKEAPVVDVSPEQRHILLVKSYDASQNTDNNSEQKLLDRAANQAMQGILKSFAKDSSYTVITLDSANQNFFVNEVGITPQQASQLCQKQGTSLLLSLDKVDVFIEEESEAYQSYDGFISRATYYMLHVEALWTLFDNTGAVLDYVIVPSSAPFDSRGISRSVLASGPTTNSAIKQIEALAFEAGQAYSTRFYPQSHPIYRPYYLLSGQLSQATSLMLYGNWQAAVEVLKPYASSEKRSRRNVKAAYNLALAYEAMGAIEEAEHWAQQAATAGDKFAIELVEDLKNYY